MILSSVITLQAEGTVDLPLQGRAIHAWLLDQVGQRNTEMAAELHSPNTIRPFTVSGVVADLANQRMRKLKLVLGQTYYIRITSIMPALSHLLIQRILPELPARIVLGNVPLRIKSYSIRPEDHPWARISSHTDLWRESNQSFGSHFTLHFASPTTFKSRSVFVPLPSPRLVFKGLLDKWNLFAPTPLPEDFLTVIDDWTAIRAYNLQATGVKLGKDDAQTLPGFWGYCNYTLRRKNPQFQQMLYTLAAFSLYAGIGKETTRGMGQTRLLVPAS